LEIEVVGLNIRNIEDYEPPTPQQNAVKHWFVKDLMAALKLTPADVYRHPQLSAKTAGEAKDVTW